MRITRSEGILDFPVAFAYLVTLAAMATLLWIDMAPSPAPLWLLAVLWTFVLGAWLNFRFERNWNACAAVAFWLSTIMITAGERIANLL
ncbi:MAG: hypothetical protein IT168_26020 [Bryobacterales bacterium]|nr:hypothetical protein [Bryobacterales bacterium]